MKDSKWPIKALPFHCIIKAAFASKLWKTEKPAVNKHPIPGDQTDAVLLYSIKQEAPGKELLHIDLIMILKPQLLQFLQQSQLRFYLHS